MTNGDKIRKMSDEELAAFITDTEIAGDDAKGCNMCIYQPFMRCVITNDCYTGIKKWLESEAQPNDR